jgi:hypothetical protein
MLKKVMGFRIAFTRKIITRNVNKNISKVPLSEQRVFILRLRLLMNHRLFTNRRTRENLLQRTR